MEDIKIKGTPNRALVCATLAYTIGFAAIILFSPLVTYLGLESEQKGILLAIVSLTGALLRIPFAAWTDKIGGKKPMLTLLLLALLGLIGITILLQLPKESVVQKLSILLLLGALAGCGIASFTVAVTQLSFWFPKNEQGKALGIVAGVGGIVPGLILIIISNFLIKSDGTGLGVVKTYFLWSVLLLVGIIVFFLLEKDPPYFQALAQTKDIEKAKQIAREKGGQEIFPSGSTIQSLFTASRTLQTWLLVIIYFACFGGFLALTNWLKEFFKDYHGMSIAIASLITSSYSMGVASSRIVGGFISDRIGGKIVLSVSIIAALVGALLLATNSIFIINIIGVIILTITMGMAGAATFKLIPMCIPHAVGGAAGWVGGLGAFGGFVIPIVLASLLTPGLPEGTIDRGYVHGFYFFVGLMLISLLATMVLPADKKEYNN